MRYFKQLAHFEHPQTPEESQMKRNISIIVLTKKVNGEIVTHFSQTSISGADVTDLKVFEQVDDFLKTVERWHCSKGEVVLSLSHSIFA